ncbi:response regulator [Cellvibrio japonicus]|uniref:Two-component response regulator n=1 Tax=Cellvibrio japonicus (strain Ueda107) TaxID=498211 RepID=B3PKH7_CELJU|nr:response regulator [Cellvibrio japonicus]ACE85707.1 two-component response regulator [Cellvibrio japonicus Ueda107]QEI12843.1 response regulator [Cellvibrio japonicus]QEI16417.1 response regulator [Cellvibrio japonicus]QEI19995.1 response regulator [Cellvibrio japonicus]
MSINILLVEDDDVAAEAVVRSLRKHALNVPVTLAQDGLEALEILRHQHPQQHIEKPYLVLLDLNMPRMNGFEFMQEVRADSSLHESVIFVLTTSDNEQDRARAYDKNIAGYMVKSAMGPNFNKLATLLDNYRNAVKLPGE